jgi:hypothetical protein
MLGSIQARSEADLYEKSYQIRIARIQKLSKTPRAQKHAKTVIFKRKEGKLA